MISIEEPQPAGGAHDLPDAAPQQLLVAASGCHCLGKALSMPRPNERSWGRCLMQHAAEDTLQRKRGKSTDWHARMYVGCPHRSARATIQVSDLHAWQQTAVLSASCQAAMTLPATHHGQLHDEGGSRLAAAALLPLLRPHLRQPGGIRYGAACEALLVQPLQGLPAASHDVAHLLPQFRCMSIMVTVRC